METIKRKSGVRYRGMIWINGKAIKSPIFKRKADCIQWESNQRAKKVERILYGDISNLRVSISLKEFSALWLKSKEAHGVAATTLDNYEMYFRKHLLPHFGGVDLKDIQKADIESLQIKLRDSHNAKGTNMIITVLKTVLKEACKEGYLIKNPAEYIKKLSEDISHDIYWTVAEINQFLNFNYHHPLHDFFLVAINTGLRKGELAGLCWDRVDFQLNTLTITRSRSRGVLKERTKTNIKRVIPMNSITRATLLNLFHKRSSSPFVFIDGDGQAIETHHIYRTFHKAQKNAGMNSQIKFHDLRHTFASQFMMNGGSIYDLQKILGHTNITMTTRYAHLSMDHLHNAVKDFELGRVKEEPNHILTMRGRGKGEVRLENVAIGV